MLNFDPSCLPAEKLRTNPAETPEPAPAEVKARIAGQVRADSRERAAPTPEHVIQQLFPELAVQRVSELLAEMAAEPAYADVKAVVAPTGRVYLFSEVHLAREAAAERCLVEEAKLEMVDKIRKDSLFIALTPLADLDRYFPSPDPGRRAALLAELRADERFQDIQTLAGPGDELHFHSDRHLSCNYGRIMMRAKANDPGLAIAELVRDRSRVMPAPTNVTLFRDRVFAISAAQLGAFVEGLARPEAAPQYADIKRLVHPETGAVYLYSEKWLAEGDAARMMDWEEVGAARNP
jgi:hypothetical protein